VGIVAGLATGATDVEVAAIGSARDVLRGLGNRGDWDMDADGTSAVATKTFGATSRLRTSQSAPPNARSTASAIWLVFVALDDEGAGVDIETTPK